MEILDAHIHLVDPARAQGVAWPGKLALPSTTARLARIAGELGVSGAIHVEASPWAADNEWVLRCTEHDALVVGVVGNLEPADPDFAEQLDRLQRYPKFRGIRYGNLWGRDLGAALARPAFQEGLRELARRGLALDAANPRPELLLALLRASDAAPELTLVLDHLPSMPQPDPQVLRELAARKLFAKVSYIPQGEEAAARERIALMWEVFAPGQLLYGSDWPNSAGHWRTYVENFQLLTPPKEAAAFYALNARRAYGL